MIRTNKRNSIKAFGATSVKVIHDTRREAWKCEITVIRKRQQKEHFKEQDGMVSIYHST
jgi:hypothetical protein